MCDKRVGWWHSSASRPCQQRPRRTNTVGTIARVSPPGERHTRVSTPRAAHACLCLESSFLGPKTCHIFENVTFSITSRDRSCKKQVAYRLVIVAIRNRSLLSSTFRVVNRCLHVYIPSVIVAVRNASWQRVAVGHDQTRIWDLFLGTARWKLYRSLLAYTFRVVNRCLQVYIPSRDRSCKKCSVEVVPITFSFNVSCSKQMFTGVHTVSWS